MDGLGRVLGCPAPCWLDNATWLMQPLRLRDWGTIEQHLLFHDPGNPLRDLNRAAGQLQDDPELAQHLLELTRADLRSNKRRRTIGQKQVMAWIGTPEGIVLSLWLCLRHNSNQRFHTLEGVERCLSELPQRSLEELVRLRDQLSGTDLLASSDWIDPLEGVRPSRRAKRLKMLDETFIPWRTNCYTWLIDAGVTPEVIGNWTLYELKLYTSSRDDLGLKDNTDGISRREARGLR